MPSLWSNIFFGKDYVPDFDKNTITVRGDSDGTIDISNHTIGHSMGQFSSVGGEIAMLPQNEQEAIKEYRKLAMTAEVDEAIQEIVNESFNIEQDVQSITIGFRDDTQLSASIQKKVNTCYNRIYHDLFDFDANGAYLFRKFYVDSRIFIHKVLNKNKKSIASLQVIEPLQMRRVRNSHSDESGLIDLSKQEVMYFYIPNMGLSSDLWGNKVPVSSDKILMFPQQSIAYIDSGIVHHQDNYVVGHLSKAIIPFNNMKMMEDAMVIYRVIRSPARRVFYVDVGDMPKSKGEQYLKDMMNQFKNKMTYDSSSGMITDRRNVVSMLEDIWLPRKSNGRSTEVSTLDEGSNLGVTEDVEYCRDRFYRSLNVPRSRFNQEQTPFQTNRLTEITRDEYRFGKFIQSLRNRFIPLIEDVLRTELELNGIIKSHEWKNLKKDLIWVFAEDNQFVQLKQAEILENKLNTLQAIDPLVDRYFSITWAQKQVMGFTDAEITELKKQQDEERKNGSYDDSNGDDRFDREPDSTDDEESDKKDEQPATDDKKDQKETN